MLTTMLLSCLATSLMTLACVAFYDVSLSSLAATLASAFLVTLLYALYKQVALPGYPI